MIRDAFGKHILINADIGERGVAHPVDDELMQHINMANIATGGHAGTFESMEHYCKLAKERNIVVCAHIGYPDVQNFGRFESYTGGYWFNFGHTQMSAIALLTNFEYQLAQLEKANRDYVKYVKFHGALYNEAVKNPEVAEICKYFINRHHLINVMMDGKLQNGIDKTLKRIEFFAERAYWLGSQNELILKPREMDGACYHDVGEAYCHTLFQLKNQGVMVDGKFKELRADTICIHSDSPIAVPLAKKLHEITLADLMVV